MNSSIILQIRNDLKDYTRQLPYPENDVRTSFFRYANSIISAYHEGFCLFDFLNELKYKIIPAQIDPRSLQTMNQLAFVLDNISIVEKIDGYFSGLNRHLILETWSIFELTITSLLYHLYNETEISDMLESDYKKINSILTNFDIPAKEINKITELIETKKHLTHYPITRKCDKLFKKIKQAYRRNINDDKDFLRFYGKYRNCFHFNFIYFGDEYHYPFKGDQFDFIDSKAIKCPDKQIGLDLFSELISIFKEITESLKDINYIKPLDE